MGQISGLRDRDADATGPAQGSRVGNRVHPSGPYQGVPGGGRFSIRTAGDPQQLHHGVRDWRGNEVAIRSCWPVSTRLLAGARASSGSPPRDARPFFLTIAMGPPHDPYKAPERYAAMYDAAKLTMRPNWTDAHGVPGRDAIAAYYAMITAVDDQSGGCSSAR